MKTSKKIKSSEKKEYREFKVNEKKHHVVIIVNFDNVQRIKFVFIVTFEQMLNPFMTEASII